MNAKPQPNDFTLLTGGAELLARIGPLWSQLRLHHAELAPQWRASFLAGSFDERHVALLAKGAAGLLVSVATQAGQDIGYCVTTISPDRTGEVDSLYVASPHRRRGVGNALMSAAMDWLTTQSVQSLAVGVISGNEDAQRFYARYGFAPWVVRLRRMSPPAISGEGGGSPRTAE